MGIRLYCVVIIFSLGRYGEAVWAGDEPNAQPATIVLQDYSITLSKDWELKSQKLNGLQIRHVKIENERHIPGLLVYLQAARDEKSPMEQAKLYADRMDSDAASGQFVMKALKLESFDLDWTKGARQVISKDPDGNLSIAYYFRNGDQNIFITAYATPEQFEKWAPEFDKLVKTLKKTK